MPIISLRDNGKLLMKEKGVIQGVLWWDEVIAKCN